MYATNSYLFSGQLSVAVWVNFFEYIYNWRSSFNFEQFDFEYKSSTCKPTIIHTYND